MGRMIEGIEEAHEGYVASVLDDGTDIGTWTAELEARTVGHRSACACEWQGPIHYDGPEELALESDKHETYMDVWYAEHIQPLLWRKNVRSAQEELRDAESMLCRAVAEARRSGGSWSEIGDVLGVTKQAVHERFTAVVDGLEAAHHHG